MSDKDTHLKNPEAQKRLALLGLAAQRREGEHECPDDDQFALLLEAGPGSGEQQHFWGHLSACESCREKWLVLTDEVERSPENKNKSGFLHGRRGLLSLVGSACAVAVGVMLYLSIDYRPVLYEDTVPQAPAEQDPTPLAETVREDGVKKEADAERLVEADAGQIVSEPKRYQRESQVQRPAKVKTGPAPKVAEAPVEKRSLEQTLSSRQSFSVASGAVKQPMQFQVFIDSFVSYCDNRAKEISRGSKEILAQGKEMGELEGTITQDQKALIDKIVQLLSSSEPVKDTELDELCDEAERMGDKTNRSPR